MKRSNDDLAALGFTVTMAQPRYGQSEYGAPFDMIASEFCARPTKAERRDLRDSGFVPGWYNCHGAKVRGWGRA